MWDSWDGGDPAPIPRERATLSPSQAKTGVDEPEWFSNMPVAANDPALQQARERNIARLMKADEADRKVLGKYLPSCVEESLSPFVVEDPVDVRVPSKEWLCDRRDPM